MTFAANIELYKSQPIALIEIALDGGTEYYSNSDIEISTGSAIRFYSGRVMAFGSISRSVSDIEGNFQISDVTTSLNNSDGKFSAYDAENFFNRVVTYRLGFYGDDLTAFENVYVGRIYNFEFRDNQLVLQVKDLTTTLLEQDFGHYVVGDDWPRANVGVVGSKMPIIYGSIKGEDFAEGEDVVGEKVEFIEDQSLVIKVAYDSDQDRHLVMNYTDNTYEGYLRAGALSDLAITYGTALNFASNVAGIALAYSTEDNKFLCLYANDTPELNAFTVTLSDSVISKSAETLVDNDADLDSDIQVVYDDKADRFLVMYISGSPTRTKARAISIDGGISIGAEATISSTPVNYLAISYDQSMNHTLMFWQDTGNAYLMGRAASISNLTITTGDEITLNDTGSILAVQEATAYNTVTGNTLIAYKVASTVYSILVKTSVDEPELVGSAIEMPGYMGSTTTSIAYDADANMFIYAYATSVGTLHIRGSRATGVLSFSSSSDLVIDSYVSATGAGSRKIAFAYDSTSKKMVLCYHFADDNSNDYGYGIAIDTQNYTNYYLPPEGITGIKCVAIDVSKGQWLVAGHKVHAIGNVFTTDNASGQNSVMFRNTDLTKSLAYTYAGGLDRRIAIITFSGTLPQENDTVYCDVEGFETAGNALIENPITMLEHFLVNYLDFTSSDYNTTNFSTAETEAITRLYKAAGMIELGSTEEARSIVESMAKSFGATIAYDTDGKLIIQFQA